jgi:putative phosphoesterase
MGVQGGIISPRARIGVVSDTHLVVHAGDIGDPCILDQLRQIAPVCAVRGNMDSDAWAAQLPDEVVLEAGGARILIVHDCNRVGLEDCEQYAAVIAGHSHRPHREMRGHTLFFNPGSAGVPRPGNPVSVGVLQVHGDSVDGEIVLLEA